MSGSYRDNNSVMSVYESGMGQSSAFPTPRDGSIGQFYLDNFNFFDSVLSPEDQAVSNGPGIPSESSPICSVTESLSLRISSIEDLVGMHQFVLWRVLLTERRLVTILFYDRICDF